MNETQEKPRITGKQVECLVLMHRGDRVPAALRPAMLHLLGSGLICAGDRGWVLTLKGKQVARHLTATV